jgi:hypothetical protein
VSFLFHTQRISSSFSFEKRICESEMQEQNAVSPLNRTRTKSGREIFISAYVYHQFFNAPSGSQAKVLSEGGPAASLTRVTCCERTRTLWWHPSSTDESSHVLTPFKRNSVCISQRVIAGNPYRFGGWKSTLSTVYMGAERISLHHEGSPRICLYSTKIRQ